MKRKCCYYLLYFVIIFLASTVKSSILEFRNSSPRFVASILSFRPHSTRVCQPLPPTPALTHPNPVTIISNFETRLRSKRQKLSQFRHSTVAMITRLPAELRNKIYKYCVADASLPPPCRCYGRVLCGSAHILWHEHTWSNKDVQKLPLLLVNKQINREILGLIHSNPCIAWPQDEECQKHTKRVALPIHYQKSGCKAWYDLTIDCHNHPSRAPSTIQKLVSYLSTFKSLSDLEIVLHIPPNLAWEVPEHHDLARLLPLLDIVGVQTKVRIEVQVDCEELDRRHEEFNAPYTSGSQPVFWSHTKKIMGRWISAWEDCQDRDERTISRKDLSCVDLVEFRDFQRQVVVVTVFD